MNGCICCECSNDSTLNWKACHTCSAAFESVFATSRLQTVRAELVLPWWVRDEQPAGSRCVRLMLDIQLTALNQRHYGAYDVARCRCYSASIQLSALSRHIAAWRQHNIGNVTAEEYLWLHNVTTCVTGFITVNTAQSFLQSLSYTNRYNNSFSTLL